MGEHSGRDDYDGEEVEETERSEGNYTDNLETGRFEGDYNDIVIAITMNMSNLCLQ